MGAQALKGSGIQGQAVAASDEYLAPKWSGLSAAQLAALIPGYSYVRDDFGDVWRLSTRAANGNASPLAATDGSWVPNDKEWKSKYALYYNAEAAAGRSVSVIAKGKWYNSNTDASISAATNGATTTANLVNDPTLSDGTYSDHWFLAVQELIKRYPFATDAAGDIHPYIVHDYNTGAISNGDLLETTAYYSVPFGRDLNVLHGGCRYEVMAHDVPEVSGFYYITLGTLKLKAVFADNRATPYQVGARCDLVADDTVALNKLFECMCRSFAVADFTGARCRITDTLIIERKRGFRVVGNGLLKSIPDINAAYPEWASLILWDGAEDGTMIECSSALFEWDGVALAGSTSQNSASAGANWAGIGFHLLRTAGLGTGSAAIPMMSCINMKTGFQFGDGIADGNAADVSYGKMFFTHVTTAMKFTTGNNVNYPIQHLHTADVDVGVLVEGGGCINIQHWHTVRCPRLLHINAKNQWVGTSNAQYTIGMIKLDEQQDVTPEIVYTEDGGAIDIDIMSGNLAGAHKADGRALFTIHRGTRLNVNSVDLMSTGAGFKILNITSSDTERQAVATFTKCGIKDTSITADPDNWQDPLGNYVDIATSSTRRYGSARFIDCKNSHARILPGVSVGNISSTEAVRRPVKDLRAIVSPAISPYEPDQSFLIDGDPQLSRVSNAGSLGATITLMNTSAAVLNITTQAPATLAAGSASTIPAYGKVTATNIVSNGDTVWRID